MLHKFVHEGVVEVNTLRQDLLNPTLKKVLETFQLDKNYVSGQGPYLINDEGKRYLDFIAQYGAVPFGYNPELVWKALDDVRARQLPSLTQPSLPGEALKLANIIAENSPGDLAYCTFCQSGTEAVEAAIKLARSTTGRKIIISTANSFHGKTLGALSATGKDSYQKAFFAPAPGFLRIPFNDLSALETAFSEYANDIAAFIVELIQGEGGIVPADPEFIKAARKLCSQYGGLLIIDEIQTGLGRTGKLFACEHYGIEPDILLLAKALGGGMFPLGVCISSPRVWNDDFGMLHSSTFANNQVTCAVGIAVMENLLADNRSLIKKVEAKGEYLLAELRKLQELYPGVIKEIRGKGLMVGIEFNPLHDCGSFDMAFICDQGGFTALLAGFLLNVCHIRLAPFLNNSMTLRLEPVLTISYEEIDYVIKALDTICHILQKQDYSKLYRYLIGDSNKPVPDKIVDYRPQERKVISSVLDLLPEKTHKFAFVMHYPGPQDVILNNPSFQSYTSEELYRFLEWESQASDPGIVCHMPAIKSKQGTVAEGWLIGVPFGGREIMSMDRNLIKDSIAAAVDLGRNLGARVIGLGALTSVVTQGGRAVTGRNVAITSGNSYTTLMAVEALFKGAALMHIDPLAARGAVLGATGSIGRACALMMSERVCQLTLFGNPKHINSSKTRLSLLVKDIIEYAAARRKKGIIDGMSAWLYKAEGLLRIKSSPKALKLLDQLLDGQNLGEKFLQELCQEIGILNPISYSLDINNVLPQCNLIIAASNSPEYLIFSRHLQPGAVVCDVARPADVAPEVLEQRDDVLLLEGGLVEYPEAVSFGPNMGYRKGVNLACLTETILLALDEDYQDYSLGRKLSLDTIQYFRSLADKHGFSLAGLKMGNRELSEEYISQIFNRSQELKLKEDFKMQKLP